MFKRISVLVPVLCSVLGAFAQAAPNSPSPYLYVSNPDQYAYESVMHQLPLESDTGRFQFEGCARAEAAIDFVRIVCTAQVQVLVFGGHPAPKRIECVQNFKLNPNIRKYLTTRTPTCR